MDNRLLLRTREERGTQKKADSATLPRYVMQGQQRLILSTAFLVSAILSVWPVSLEAADKMRTIKYAAIQDSQRRYLAVGEGRRPRFVKTRNPETFWTVSIEEGRAAIATQKAKEFLTVSGSKIELSTAGDQKGANRWRVITGDDVYEKGASLRGILQVDGDGVEWQLAVDEAGTLSIGKSGEKLLIEPWSP